jgi:hypothetical protein
MPDDMIGVMSAISLSTGLGIKGVNVTGSDVYQAIDEKRRAHGRSSHRARNPSKGGGGLTIRKDGPEVQLEGGSIGADPPKGSTSSP